MSTTRLRTVGPAVCLAVFPVLFLVAEVIAPWPSADQTQAESLARAGERLSAVNTADLLFFLGVLLAVPGWFAVMRLTRDRAPVASLIGGTLAVAGYVAGMLQVVAGQYDVLLSPLADTAGVPDAVESSTAWVLAVVLTVFLVGMLLGPIVLGVALWRSHAAPVWTGVAFAFSSVAGLVGHAVDLQWLDLAGLAVLAVAAIVVAGRAVRADAGTGRTDRSDIATTSAALPAS